MVSNNKILLITEMSNLVRKIRGIYSNKLFGVNISTDFRAVVPANSYFASLAFHKK